MIAVITGIAILLSIIIFRILKRSNLYVRIPFIDNTNILTPRSGEYAVVDITDTDNSLPKSGGAFKFNSLHVYTVNNQPLEDDYYFSVYDSKTGSNIRSVILAKESPTVGIIDLKDDPIIIPDIGRFIFRIKGRHKSLNGSVIGVSFAVKLSDGERL